MNFILKIVEGPNKGAEIALVEGVAVTFGKGDDCDIVLADSTLPAAPISIEASSAGVTVDGEALDVFHVKTVGSTSFAVGPADEAWGELVWRKAEEESHETSKEEGGKNDLDTPRAASPTPPPAEAEGESPHRKRSGCLGCLLALMLVVLLLAVVGWFFKDWLKETYLARTSNGSGESSQSGRAGETGSSKADSALGGIAAKYGLASTESNGVVRLSGNLKTRRERLAATAEAYAAQPGVELDISDDESFRVAAEDALFTLTEGALRVSQATNRFLTVDGSAHTPAALARTLKALNSDLPKLRNVDVKAVRFTAAADVEETAQGEGGTSVPAVGARARARKAAAKPEFPVCGILTAPYPCLVMKNGSRVLEGASVGGFVVEKIEADSVTVTNSTGRFTWKP